MKTTIQMFICFICCMLAFGCYQDESIGEYPHTAQFIVSGDCPVVTVKTNTIEEIFYELDNGNDFIQDARCKDDGVLHLSVIKHTDDDSMIEAFLYVDGILVSHDSSPAPYAEITLQYDIE